MSDVEQLDVQTVAALFDAGDAVIVDVREPQEREAQHEPATIHKPMSNFDPSALPELKEGQKLVFMCAMGGRSDAVASQLLSGGYIEHAVNMVGGIHAWSDAGLPVAN